MGRLRSCVSFKTVYSPSLGKTVRRCAKFRSHGKDLIWRYRK